MNVATVARRVHLRPDCLDVLAHIGGAIGLSNLINAAMCVAVSHPEEVKDKVDEIRSLYGHGKPHTRWTRQGV